MSSSMIPKSASSSKRKRNDGKNKLYAVKCGIRPGVYNSWKECQAQITGFSGANYKSFTNFEDAQSYVAGKTVANPPKSTNKTRFYGVAVGHCPGVYTDWEEASMQIKDTKKPIFKKFSTFEEARLFVQSGGKEHDCEKNILAETPSTCDPEKTVDEVSNPSKKVKKNSEITINSQGLEPGITDTDPRQTETENSKLVVAYTDGSSRGNGTAKAKAGIGVYFGKNDPRNISEPLLGTPQTNQRAELSAIWRAIQICPESKNLRLFTDSNYSIKCLTTWYKGWLKNKWRTASGSPVLNRDLIQAVRTLINHRDSCGVTTELQWVRGHDNDPGNEAADQLAVAGSYASR
ncbi:ribonuclease H [Blumeria hordei DH14]|uniref:Ribonuclease H n=1 Tax=Blumeria graminis f. sp. hordei (strain DH14) TaxID=546991 RepID=N1JKV3_BLUG1|nr:ribonuclease H [Blumeria hordei DH14]